jgi:Tfp pilus assembly protein PilV
MRCSSRGVSTVECLVALTLFSLGALGAAGTITLGIRTAATGTHLSSATRMAGEAFEAAQSQLRSGRQSCSVLRAGSRNGPGGETISWTVQPAVRGARLIIALTYATPTGQRTDTILGFLRCH